MFKHIQKAINDKKKVSFTYYQYNHDKKLEQRGGKRVVSPITLLWANGYYYLVAYSEKYEHNVNYRVDIMKHVCISKENSNLNKVKIDVLKYKNQHPIMFGDDPERITIKCKKYIINNVIDSFGIDVNMLECKDDKDFVKFSTWASYGGTNLWALQYIQDCEVIKPEKMREEIKNILQQGTSKY